MIEEKVAEFYPQTMYLFQYNMISYCYTWKNFQKKKKLNKNTEIIISGNILKQETVLLFNIKLFA